MSFEKVSKQAPTVTNGVGALAPDLSATAPNETRAMKVFWYALTFPPRLILVFACALVLIFGICFQGFRNHKG